MALGVGVVFFVTSRHCRIDDANAQHDNPTTDKLLFLKRSKSYSNSRLHMLSRYKIFV